MKKLKKQKMAVVLGPTATGKSNLAVILAKKCNGEVVSADSRQVYRGLDIGTGKVTKRGMCGVPHHMLNVANPKRKYTVAQYRRDALRAIDLILKRNKLPILCGGSGFYIQSIVDDFVPPEVKPDTHLRKKLSKLTPDELLKKLNKLDPKRAKTIEQKNPRRVIRAIEIATAIGKTPPMVKNVQHRMLDILQIGIDLPDEMLQTKIHDRLIARMKKGMVAEAKRLHQNGLVYRRMEELGLEYKYLAFYLQGKISRNEMLEELERAIWHYAKRQRTWFKRDKRIRWFRPNEYENILDSVQDFILLK